MNLSEFMNRLLRRNVCGGDLLRRDADRFGNEVARLD